MVTRERRLDRGRRQARRRLATIGDELREARLAAGLTQREVADSVGISHSEISRIEHAAGPRVPFETLVIIGAVLGLDIAVRAFPYGDAIRDLAQVDLLARFRGRLHTSLTWRTEVPLRIPGDLRAWDAEVSGPGWRIPVDAESRVRDVQALSRRLTLKARDDGIDTMILLVAGTRHNRHVFRLVAADLATQFPVKGSTALAALDVGEPPAGSAIVFL